MNRLCDKICYHFRNEAEEDGLEESIEMLNTN